MNTQVQILNLRRLGSGGYAEVFVGERSDNGEKLVVKYLREYNDPHARKAFVREVRVLSRKHRGLVQVLGADVNAERPYYVMPYFRGGMLTRYAGRLTEAQLHAVATEIALALAAIHVCDAHGDVKPDNILVSGQGTLQLADPLGSGVNCTMLFAQNHGGTPGFWAPEVRMGAPISAAADVYSYGATLYHLLTGNRPQDGQQLDVRLRQVVDAPKIREVIAACCHADPNFRPTMQEVIRVLNGESWADILRLRIQIRQFVGLMCVIGIVVLAGKALGS